MSAGPTPASRKPSGLPGWVVPVAVLGAIAAILVLPARDQLRPAAEPELKPLELTALLAYRAGDTARAQEILAGLADDLNAPPALRQRVTELLAALKG